MITPTLTDLAPYKRRLMSAYVDYCRSISKRSMAINIETAALLWYQCDQVQAGSVCDLGSGFTSYVLACYAADIDGHVCVMSVDDDAVWSNRSAGFLRRHRLPADSIMLYDTWTKTSDTFDVIVHDFNSGTIRDRTMWEAAARVNTGGVIIFDDAQNEGHRTEMGNVATAYGWPFVDVHPITVDDIGRFAGMVTT